MKTIPLRTDYAMEVAKHFLQELFLNYGPPVVLLSENGGCFVSRLFKEVCNQLSVQKLFTTTYHPKNNWQVEC